MIQNVIKKLIEKGWSLDMIAAKTGICVNKLRHHGELNEAQENSLLRIASVEARIDLDECFEGDE